MTSEAVAVPSRGGVTAIRWEVLVVAGLLLIAALLRFADLPTRGTWDGDQGHDMLVLRAFVRDGVVPLLGPPTSIGDVHHGAWYYYLLAPVAWLTGGDSPTAVVAVIATAGLVAVAVVWWLARAIAGPVAGLVAGLALATSTAAVEGSTFIWNPNLIALSSAIALTGGWRAWRGDSAWWWTVAAVGTAVTMQCHVLGIALLPVLGIPFAIDLRRRGRTLDGGRGRGRIALVVAAVFVAAYLPLLVNELTTGGSETAALLAYLARPGDADAAPLPVRAGVVGLRVVSWPLVGLITNAFVPAVLATMLVIAVSVFAWRRGRPGTEAVAARWLGLGLLWTIIFLAIAAPSLAYVVRGLPNDHYHAFANPSVVVLLGVGLAVVGRLAGREGAVAVTAAVVAICAWNVTHLPAASHPDGGWPAGERAGAAAIEALRGAGIAADDAVLLRSLPAFKSTEAVAYPLVRDGQAVIAETPRGLAPGSVGRTGRGGMAPAASVDPGVADGDVAGAPRAIVLLCDDLFVGSIGAPCGGPAEDRAVRAAEAGAALVARIEAHPGRWVSVYATPAAP